MKHNSFNYIHNDKGIKGFALVFSCTPNDEILVPGLMESFDFCEHFICYYDEGTNFDYDEAIRHLSLIREAEKHGAEWIYLTQPTMRCTKDWDNGIKFCTRNLNGILFSPCFYFWDYSLNKVRTDSWSGKSGGCFFKSNPYNSYRTGKLHHIATPINLSKISCSLPRFDLRRLGKEVCIGKADYYQKLDGTPHNGLRDFSTLKVKTIDPKALHIKGLGKNELEYIKKIQEKYCETV